jgi:hypothetical protein
VPDVRSSYWKTVAAALFAGVGSAAVAIGLFAMGWPVAGLAALPLTAAAFCGLVAGGGLIALHRHALEARGQPYPPRRRERVAGSLRRALGGRTARLRPGDLVQVKPLDAILATLDDRGTRDALPFMPEMAAHCGKQFRVLRRAEKIYDWVQHTGLRRLRDAVLLDGLRCDGAGHGGCQAACALLWKEAWLERVPAAAPGHAHPRLRPADLDRLSQSTDESGAPRYTCQITQLAGATTPLAWGDPRHYLRDLTGGNVRLGPFLTGVALALFGWVQRKRGAVPFPVHPSGKRGEKTTLPEPLHLQAGDVVRVKAKHEIAPTLDPRSRNRGLRFDAEMLRFCGGEYRVATRIERLIDERSGKMIRITNPCLILEGVTATGEYQAFCAQNESIFWREIWLERAGTAGAR